MREVISPKNNTSQDVPKSTRTSNETELSQKVNKGHHQIQIDHMKLRKNSKLKNKDLTWKENFSTFSKKTTRFVKPTIF